MRGAIDVLDGSRRVDLLGDLMLMSFSLSSSAHPVVRNDAASRYCAPGNTVATACSPCTGLEA